MKKIISVLLLSVAIFTFAFSSPATAANAANGAALFKANCAQCHLGGKNLVCYLSSVFKFLIIIIITTTKIKKVKQILLKKKCNKYILCAQ